ncbi:hypothetical protein AALO_G00137930 [Alosa alosa]|uniref:Uncharacterized protein n=1 Tax=Alosa alosa TaxID=278164 RepID=A0AAV6GP25_9TELE|nr:putative uncharacterized protein GUCA1ANB [Alosa sapidissima]XP_048111644.1 putative uncharacterized protein GUCA1ANB [Alosa alosa]KAG5274586.1 hypothetical protein AALO_G00137930 [Alosa alosa]
MEMTPCREACKRSQTPVNPLKTIIPINASKNKVVDKQLNLLVFSWWQRQQDQVQLSPACSCDHNQESQTAAKEPQSTLTNIHTNSLIPFYSAVKPTCGYRFSRDTDHRRKTIGIPTSNPVMWKNNIPTSASAQQKSAPK